MSNLKDKLQELKKQMADLRTQIKEQAKAFFKEASQELFVTHPELKSFGWNQYTPYFNDGETCIFRCNTEEINLKMKGDDPDEDDEDYFSGYDMFEIVGGKRIYYDNLTMKQKAGKDVLAFLEVFDEADYEEMFGDHVSVTVTKEGVSTDEYDHD